jgi:hypothetical protein
MYQSRIKTWASAPHATRTRGTTIRSIEKLRQCSSTCKSAKAYAVLSVAARLTKPSTYITRLAGKDMRTSGHASLALPSLPMLDTSLLLTASATNGLKQIRRNLKDEGLHYLPAAFFALQSPQKMRAISSGNTGIRNVSFRTEQTHIWIGKT